MLIKSVLVLKYFDRIIDQARRAALATLLQNEQLIYEEEFRRNGKALYKDLSQINPQSTPIDLYR